MLTENLPSIAQELTEHASGKGPLSSDEAASLIKYLLLWLDRGILAVGAPPLP